MSDTPRSAGKRPPGRPRKPAAERKRAILGLRVRDELKAALETIAEGNQRSLSEEAEFRLELSLRAPAVLDEALDLAFGREISGLLLALARVMHDTGTGAVMHETFTAPGPAGAFKSPWAFDLVIQAVDRILAALRPVGDAVPPKRGDGLDELYAVLGRAYANGVLKAIAFGEGSQGELQKWAAPIRDKLGPDLVARIRQFIERERPAAIQKAKPPRG